METAKEIIRIEGLNKTFHTKDGEVVALDNIHLEIAQGEIFGSCQPNIDRRCCRPYFIGKPR